MYYRHFQVNENPFRPTPDPRYLYLSAAHQEALDHLIYGIAERKGFVMITGGVGTGKTTLLRALLNDLDEKTGTALLLNPFLSEDDLFPTLCDEFAIPAPKEPSRKNYLDAINSFLMENFAKGKNAVLLIDEAQNLSRDVLEQIRILSNLETESEKLLQIVLVGQEELKQVLGQNALRQINERIGVRYELTPLEREDVAAYIAHRMGKAGNQGRLPFTKGALDAIYRASGGNPRRINAICDRALLAAYSRQSAKVDKKTVWAAAAEVTGKPLPSRYRPQNFGVVPALLTALVLLLLVYIGYDFLRDRQDYKGLARQTEQAARLTNPAVVPEEGPGMKTAPAMAASSLADTVSKGEQASATILDVPDQPLLAQDRAEQALPENQGQQQGSWRLSFAEALAGELAIFAQNPQAARGQGGALFTLDADTGVLAKFLRPFRAAVLCENGMAGCFALVDKADENKVVVYNDQGQTVTVERSVFEEAFAGRVMWLVPERAAHLRAAPGDRGAVVLRLQQILNQSGYPLETDGVYGPKTLAAVLAFQRDFGLPDDGVAGFATMGLAFQLTRSDAEPLGGGSLP
ncbi:MAG: AAA family ATPase [Desulfatibacillaceae bacterium]|nr:AAA family ATPase [Desulfatibacillaceae bacterium]